MRRLTIALLLVAHSALASAQQPVVRASGRSLTGLPALNFDADEGVGYGALLQYYDYGRGIEPYRFTIQPTLFLTTKGRKDVSIFVDAPHLLPGNWRVAGSVAREQQLATPYYGVGNNSVADPSATTGANPYFYRFGRTLLRASADVQHSIAVPSLRVLVGAGARSATVRPVPYNEGTTLLAQSAGRSDLPASDTRYARVGLVLDTRDREIGTHSGTWSEFLVQRSARVLGGDESFTRLTASVRQFFPLGANVTLAQRVVAQTVSGEPSVSELFTIQSSYRDDEGLGGASTIRGIPKNRYVGKGVAFSNSELRWSAAGFSLAGRQTRVILSGFLDAGRVWTGNIDFSEVATDLHVGYGGGVRLGIGPSFVLATDVGHSSQSTAAIYIGLGYLF